MSNLSQTSNYERLYPKPGTLGWRVIRYMAQRAALRTQFVRCPFPVRILDQVQFVELLLPAYMDIGTAERLAEMARAWATI